MILNNFVQVSYHKSTFNELKLFILRAKHSDGKIKLKKRRDSDSKYKT